MTSLDEIIDHPAVNRAGTVECVQRREILKAAVGSAALAGGLAAPWVGNAQTAAGISLKVQSRISYVPLPRCG